MRFRDHKGLIWTRSEDGTRVTADNGAVVIGRPEMSSEYLISVAYQDDPEFQVEAVQDNQ